MVGAQATRVAAKAAAAPVLNRVRRLRPLIVFVVKVFMIISRL
jgi:hypothetical protein